MIKLYSYFRSSSSYRVRIALNLKDIDYQILPVHLLKDGGEQFKPEFDNLNKAHRIPVIEHNNKVLAQSVAIIQYLESQFPKNPLIPSDAYEKALCFQLTEIINSDIQPLQNLSALKKLVNDYKISEEQKISWIQHWIELGLQSYEKILEKTSGQYSIGDQPTMADCFLIPQLYNAHRFQLNMENFPLINKIEKNAELNQAFVKAHPNNQPDTPSENK